MNNEVKYVKAALEMARQMTILADEGESETDDYRCAVLFGLIRDCAYSIRRRAEGERELSRALGIWQRWDTNTADKGEHMNSTIGRWR